MTNFITKIGLIADIYDGPHATPKKTATGPYFLSISSLDKGRLDLSKSAHLDEKDFKQWTRRVTPQEEDLLFSYETRLGEAALMPAGIKACLGRRMGLLRPYKDKVIPAYLLYAFLSPYFQQTIVSKIIRGATVDRIALNELPSFNIRIPSLEEQKRVSSLLQDIDTKIEFNNRINTELEAMAKTLYDYWFVQFDFPDETGKPYKSSGGKMIYNDTLKREIPEGWEAKYLGEIETNIITGKTPPKIHPEYFDGEIPFITIGDIRGNMHVVETQETLSKLGAYFQSSKYINKGAICVSCIASPGLVGFATKLSQTNQQINSIECNNEENKYYLYFVIKDFFVTSKAKTGNTFPNMNKGDFADIMLVKPSNKVLQLFDIKIKSSIDLVLNKTIENQQLTQLRDWLLPMLMNGQVRVN